MRDTRVRSSPSYASLDYVSANIPTGRNNTVLPAQSPMNAGDIQFHLYQALLDGRTADVSLHVKGTWEGVYKLHRVVLIQAGFFRSLFDGGFRESSCAPEVKVTFDDPNITRAAFEICVSHLYGGGPSLHVDPRLVPTRATPLTSSFPELKPVVPTPADHHPATPRFLLSLLATSIYLSIPTLATQALSRILNCVGPQTALPYLNFACGKPIACRSDDEPEAAVGLEHVCRILSADIVSTDITESRSVTRKPSLQTMRSSTSELEAQKLDDLSICQKEGPADVTATDLGTTHPAHDSRDITDADSIPYYYYGPVSDKIGEAAVSWLTRWGADVLSHEDATAGLVHPPSQPSDGRRRATVSGTAGSCSGSGAGLAKRNIPVIWSRGGLEAKWVRALLSADSFFVANERERYNFACRVAEVRRQQGILEEEEREWEELFANGIYYMHMSLDDLMEISRHVSPSTGRPYTPLAVLQSAHWDQSLLRQHVTSKPLSSSGSLTSELGITVRTAQLLASVGDAPDDDIPSKQKLYYPVSIDTSLRIGDVNVVDGKSMEQLFTTQTQLRTDRTKTPASTSAANFFGILRERRTVAECIAADSTGTARWTPYPPFRFGAEFWGIESHRDRLHSQTVWYAGSLFNFYVQVVRKKGVQLGIYLHRQSSVDPIPAPSMPPVARSSERAMTHGRNSSLPTNVHPAIPSSASTPTLNRPPSAGGVSVVSRSTTPVSSSSQSSPNSAAPPIVIHAPLQPYRDPRTLIHVYFNIYCASPTGSSLTRFSSSPDTFKVGQSWGWKSASLYVQSEDGEAPPPSLLKEVSVRAVGVIGVV